jgi:hypothetical protein
MTLTLRVGPPTSTPTPTCPRTNSLTHSNHSLSLTHSYHPLPHHQVGGKAVKRVPGDRWMIKGPCEYVPAITVEVVETRKAIPLDDNEGVYVRDTQTGKVRAVIGQTYMLTETEELWMKELPPTVEALLHKSGMR